MRKLLCLFLLAACELQPAPKKEPAPPPPAEPPPPPPAARPAEPTAGSAADTPPRIAITDDCLQVAVHVAQVIVSNATDAAQKSVYEQERPNMVRKTGEACTTQAWSDAARKCYLGTKAPADITKCEQKFSPPPAPPSAPPPGAS
jgi:hypothetical protein